MTSTSLETWVKSMTEWQLKQFGRLSVQEDVNIVEREIDACARFQSEEAPLSAPSIIHPDSPARRSRSADTPDSSCDESHSDLL